MSSSVPPTLSPAATPVKPVQPQAASDSSVNNFEKATAIAAGIAATALVIGVPVALYYYGVPAAIASYFAAAPVPGPNRSPAPPPGWADWIASKMPSSVTKEGVGTGALAVVLAWTLGKGANECRKPRLQREMERLRADEFKQYLAKPETKTKFREAAAAFVQQEQQQKIAKEEEKVNLAREREQKRAEAAQRKNEQTRARTEEQTEAVLMTVLDQGPPLLPSSKADNP